MTESVQVFGEIPAYASARWGDCEALCYESTRMSFSQLDAEVDRAARALLARGVGPGDVVGLWVTNCPEFVIAFFATLKVGAIAAPMNTRYREHDVDFAIRLAECKLLFVIERSGPVDYLEMLKAVLPNFDDKRFIPSDTFPKLRDVVVISDAPSTAPVSWEEFNKDAEGVSLERLQDAASRVQSKDIALIIFTSGTTGKPKAVMHDHSIVRNLRERHELWPLRAGDAVLNFLPMFHLYGMTDALLAAVYMGERQVIMNNWDPVQALSLIECEMIAGLHGFETHYADMMKAQKARQADCSSLRFGTLPAGMENSNAVALKVQKTFCPTVSGMGMSETGCFVCMTDLNDTEEQRCTTAGRPMDGLEVKVVDPQTREDLPVGAEGELLYRGYTIMRGYFRDERATAETIDGDGWLYSGDRGFIRPDGFIQFLGRYKEMLKVGGENVSPSAVEQDLLDFVPTIESVAVVGVPDVRLAEVPLAYVVSKPGKSTTVSDIVDKCKGKIASFKIPRYVIEIDALPVTASGKVQRVMLKQRAAEELDRLGPPAG